MKGSAHAAWLVVPLCGLLCGCGSSKPLEQTVEETHRIDPGADISITNRDGSIQVYGSDKPELYVKATKKAYTRARLDGISVNVAARPDSASIKTTFPPNKRWSLSDRSGTVDYVVVIPATATISRLELNNGEILITGMEGRDLHAHLGSGRLFGKNCFADLHFQVGTGGLALIYEWWEQRRFSVDAAIENGNASVAMPGNASFHIVAKSENGRITNDFAGEEKRTDSASPKVDLIAGKAPTAEMKIHVQNGNIELVEANP